MALQLDILDESLNKCKRRNDECFQGFVHLRMSSGKNSYNVV